MILHLAAFTWAEGVDSDQVAELSEALTSMAAQIPEIRSYRCGVNLHLRPNGSDYAVAALVDDQAGLDAYLDSPAHVAVYERLLGRMIGTRAAAQLEVGDAATL